MRKLESSLRELPARQREAFMLRNFEGLDVARDRERHGLLGRQRQDPLLARRAHAARATGRGVVMSLDQPAAWRSAAGRCFDDSVDGVDMAMRSRLTRARHAALEAAAQPGPRGWFSRSPVWAPAAGVAAAAVLATASGSAPRWVNKALRITAAPRGGRPVEPGGSGTRRFERRRLRGCAGDAARRYRFLCLGGQGRGRRTSGLGERSLVAARYWLVLGTALMVAAGAGRSLASEPPSQPTPPAETPDVPDDEFIEFLGADDHGDAAWWEMLKNARGFATAAGTGTEGFESMIRAACLGVCILLAAATPCLAQETGEAPGAVAGARRRLPRSLDRGSPCRRNSSSC